MQLDGKVALITGGTRGIGRGIAEAFHREGATVVINGRSAEKGRQALKEMGTDRIEFVQADVSERGECDSLVAATITRFGRVDILVNNAGGGAEFAPVAQMTDEMMEQSMRLNFFSTFWCTRAALDDMLARQSGRIINISSVEGKHGKPGMANYTAAKHAVHGLTKSVAREVGTMGITVNAICPGLIETDAVRDGGATAAAAMGLTYEGLLELFASESAIKRLNTVDEVAALAVLLASDVGAGITGAMLSVDGGTAAY